MAEDPFKSPFDTPDFPGGALGQVLFSQFVADAERQSGTSLYRTGNDSPYESLKGNLYNSRQSSMLRLAAEQESRQLALAISSPFVLAGRELSPEMTDAINTFSDFASPHLAMGAAKSGGVRELLSLFGGGMSPVNVGLGMEGLSRRMRDPITQSQGFRQESINAVSDRLIEMSQQRESFTRSDGSVVPIGPRASRGMSELELLQTTASMSFRGELPTRSLLLDLAADDGLQSAIDRGDVTAGDFTASSDSLDRTNRRLQSQGYSEAHSPYEGIEGLHASGIRGSIDVEEFRQQTRIRNRLLESNRMNLQDAAIQNDQLAVDSLLPGAAQRISEMAKIRERIAAGTATDADRLSLSSLESGISSLNRMSLDEFDSRALEFVTTAGSKLGQLAPDDAKDLAAALAARNQGDQEALGKTRYGRLGRDEKLDYIAALTSQDVSAVGVAVTGYTAGEFRDARSGRADAADPFLLGEIKKIDDAFSASDPATVAIQSDQAERFNRAILERTKAIAAAKDFLTNEELSRSLAEVNTMAEQLVTQLSSHSMHQVSGASMEQSIRYIQTAANRVNYSRDQILAIASLANQEARQNGFENPVGTALQKRHYASANRYRDLNTDSMGLLGYDTYGMDSGDELSRKDKQLEMDVRRSENVSVAATASLLSRRAGVNVDSESVTGRLIREANAGVYSEETRTFLAKSQNEKLQQIAADTARPLDEVIRTANNRSAVEKEVHNRPNIVEAGLGSARKTAFDNVAVLMQGGTTGLVAGRLGLRGRERDEFTRNLTQGAARLVRDSVPELVTDTTSIGVLAGTFAGEQYEAISSRAKAGNASAQTFLDSFGSRDDAINELRITYETMGSAYTERSGSPLVDATNRAGTVGNRIEATGRARDEAEAILSGLLSEHEPDPKKRAFNTMLQMGKSGVGRTLTEIVTNFMGIDSSGEVPRELLNVAEYFDQLGEQAKTLGAGESISEGERRAFKDRQAALEDVADKLRRAVKDSPVLRGEAARIVAGTRRTADGRPEGAAADVDQATALKDLEDKAKEIMDAPEDVSAAPGSGDSAMTTTAASGIVQIKEANVEVINFSGANISLNGTPVLTNASGTVARTNRTGINAVAGTV